MQPPPPQRSAEFELVHRAPPPVAAPLAPPRPTRPERPLGVTILAVLGMAWGGAMLAGFLAALAFFTVVGSELGTGGVVFGALLAVIAFAGLPFGLGAMAVGWGMWRGARWAWVGALVLCGLAALVPLRAVTSGFEDGIDLSVAPGGPPTLGVLALLAIPVGAFIYLLQPEVRDYFGKSARSTTGAATPREAGSNAGLRVLLTLAAAAAIPLVMVVAWYPLASLTNDADGASLATDAVFGLVAGGITVAAGVAGIRLAAGRDGAATPAAWLVALGTGLFVALLLGSAAQGAANAPLLDDKATGDDGAMLLYRFSGFGAFAAIVFVVWRVANPLVAAARWGGALAVGLGAAAGLLSLFLLANAPDLQAAAEARERHSTPGVELALVLSICVVVAVWRRTRRA